LINEGERRRQLGVSTLEKPQLRQQNRRMVLYLLGWIALLVVASVIVIWVRN
jgi:hypothetical protein